MTTKVYLRIINFSTIHSWESTNICNVMLVNDKKYIEFWELLKYQLKLNSGSDSLQMCYVNSRSFLVVPFCEQNKNII